MPTAGEEPWRPVKWNKPLCPTGHEAGRDGDAVTVAIEFERTFRALTGHSPFPWQARLFKRLSNGDLPSAVDIPTGLGKTAVMAIWLLARAAGAKLPRRLVYVVDRRAVVDQATDFAEEIRKALQNQRDLEPVRAGLKLGNRPLAISTLRGRHRDNREWLADPAAPAIIVGTVDMVGSRLLFEGYGVSRKMRPYAAGLMGCDTLVLLDEAHLSRPFERLLKTIEKEQQASAAGNAKASRGCFAGTRANVCVPPPFHVLPLSATLGNDTESAPAFSIDGADLKDEIVHKRLNASKTLRIMGLGDAEALDKVLAEQAWCLMDGQAGTAKRKPVRMLIYCDRRMDAEKVADHLRKRAEDEAPETEVILFVGGRRIYEREKAAEKLRKHGFVADGAPDANTPVFLVSTSAGEVGVDLDADHMVCDLVPWERMVQRLGRVNRRGEGAAQVLVVDQGLPDAKNVDEPKNDCHRAVGNIIKKLPPENGDAYQASPAALISLRESLGTHQLLDKASTPPPLHPALTRPLVDAWAMTSLLEHTGRPEVGPWLRGWVDEEPQTTLVWRRHLPVQWDASSDVRPMTNRDVEAFFEAAAPQAAELLETEAWRARDWLRKRARKLLKAATKQQDPIPNLSPLTANAPIAFLIREVEKPEPLSLQSICDSKADELLRKLEGQKLVLDARLGGLNEGLLDDNEGAVLTIEDNWGRLDAGEGEQTDGGSQPAMRVQILSESVRSQQLLEDGELQKTNKSPPKSWQEALGMPCCLAAEGEPIKWLVVEKWRDKMVDEETRAIAPVLQSLVEHQEWAAREAAQIADALDLPREDRAMLQAAACHHDDGKKAARWQRAFNAPRTGGGPYAKTPGPVNRRQLNGYRHEFQSVIDAESKGLDGLERHDFRFDLALHLIAAHHGHARPTISIEGCDSLPPTAAGGQAHEVALRFARLQRQWGPWGLAWWEALLRAADQKASKALAEKVRWQQIDAQSKTPLALASQGIQRDMFAAHGREAT